MTATTNPADIESAYNAGGDDGARTGGEGGVGDDHPRHGRENGHEEGGGW